MIFASQLVYIISPGLDESGHALAVSMMRVIAVNPFLFAIATVKMCIRDRLSGYRPTRPQAEAALLFVKTARSGSCHQVAKGVEIVCKTRYFEVRVV